MPAALDRDRIWSAAESIDGWFYRDAAHAMIDLLMQVIRTTPPDCALLEVGVVAVVGEILAGPRFVPVARAGDLLAIRRSSQGPAAR